MSQFFLMHKNDICGSLEIDPSTSQIEAYKDHHTGKSPFLGNCDIAHIKKWWSARSVPASRKMMQKILKKSGCLNMESYLAKNLALSMTDAYWICPINMDLKYEDIKLQTFASVADGRVPYHNDSSYDMNASLGGQMEKYWDLKTNVPTLVKESYKNYGQQAINEVFATLLHESQNTDIPFVKYNAIRTRDNGVICRCAAFTNDLIELVPAAEVIDGAKCQNDKSLYENYIQICIKLGIDEAVIRSFMDYQALTDFIISNSDEHLLNFGILRNSETFEYIGPAPIFDSGNSMFYDKSNVLFSRAELLEQKTNSFYQTEEKMLKNIKDKNIVDLSLLPKHSDVIDLYVTAGMPEENAEFIAKNYDTKVELAQDFQHGVKISLYNEKQHEKTKSVRSNSSVSFSMICGIPGSGKTEKANELKKSFIEKGYTEIDSKQFYSIDDMLKDTKYIINEVEPHKAITNQVNEKLFICISPNEVRKEFVNFKNDDMVFYLIDKRIKEALDHGVSVIYEATNLDSTTRQHYVELSGQAQKNLYLMNIDIQKANTSLPFDLLKQMELRLYSNPPTSKEGWTNIYENGKRPNLEKRDVTLDLSDKYEEFDIGDER